MQWQGVGQDCEENDARKKMECWHTHAPEALPPVAADCLVERTLSAQALLWCSSHCQLVLRQPSVLDPSQHAAGLCAASVAVVRQEGQPREVLTKPQPLLLATLPFS